jgi:hypothetical protein
MSGGSAINAFDRYNSEPNIVSGHNDGTIRIFSIRDK